MVLILLRTLGIQINQIVLDFSWISVQVLEICMEYCESKQVLQGSSSRRDIEYIMIQDT